ncbi:MAG: hypothetical protein JXQ90_04895 [Cyclobacteriaceae bacterium]
MPNTTRQLAAVLFSDIVGYTALMGKDSAKALELVRISKDIQKPLVEKHNGKWLKEMGDGAMAQFGSALDAVQCAIEIQAQARAKLDAKLRIGIHLGDITVEGDDIYGDGVNVASRIESLADPGGICISESVEKAIRGQSITTVNLGTFELKNVDYPVQAYAIKSEGLPIPIRKLPKKKQIQKRASIIAGLAVGLTTLIYFFGSSLFIGSSTKSATQYDCDVAVMYLDNMTDNEKYADQLVHLIHTNLADQEDLKVASRQWIYDATKEISGEARNPNRNEATEVAREIGARTMLVGTVIQQNNDVQVQVELVDVQTGDILGSERVNGQMASIFTLADLISNQINAPLQIESDYNIAEITTTNYDAFESYYAGMNEMWNYRFGSARDHFKSAIEQDSTFALAWMQYALTSDIYSGINIHSDIQPQIELIEQALSLSKRLPRKERLYVDAMYATFTGDKPALYDIFTEIYAIDQDDRFCFALLGALQSDKQLNLHDSLLVLFLDRNPNSGFEVNSLAYRLAAKGDHEKARRALRKYIELEPQNFNPWHSAWEVCMIIGDLESALKYADTLATKFPASRRWRGLSRFYGNMPKSALEESDGMNELSEFHSMESFTMVHNSYVLQGKFEQALEVISEQFEMQSFNKPSDVLSLQMQSAKTLIWMKNYGKAKSRLEQVIRDDRALPDSVYSPMEFLGQFFLGILAARQGDENALHSQIEILETMLSEGKADFRFEYYPVILQGELALLQNNLETLNKVLTDSKLQVMYRSLYIKRLEYLYHWKNGNFQGAIDILTRYYRHVGSARWIYGGDQNFYAVELAFSPYWLGRILEDAGRLGEASAQYQIFLANFVDADPGIIEKKDAMRRMNELQ